MSSIVKLHRQILKSLEAATERFRELDIAGTDDEVQALLEGLIGPGIGGNIESINAILDTVSAYTGDEVAEDNDGDGGDDGDDYEDNDGDVEEDEDDFADDGDAGDDDDSSEEDDDDFADDGDEDDFADDGDAGDDDDFSDDDSDESVEDDEDDEPAPPRRSAKPVAKPAAKPTVSKPAKPSKPQPAPTKPAPKAAAAKPGKLSKAAQRVQAMSFADMKAHFLGENGKRGGAIDKAVAGAGPRNKAATLFAYAQSKGWIA